MEQNGLWQDLMEAQPDMVATMFPSAADERGAGNTASLRNDLKKVKYRYVTAEKHRRFAEHAREKHLAEAPAGLGFQSSMIDRKANKNRSKATKERIAREEEVHNQLLRELSDVYRRSRILHARCLQQVQDLATPASAGDEDVDMGIEEVTAQQHQAVCEASVRNQEVGQLLSAKQHQAATRQKLEDEFRAMQVQRRRVEANRSNLLTEEKLLQEVVATMMDTEKATEKLGLTMAQFDDENGSVLLGEPPSAQKEGCIQEITQAHRTVVVSWSDQDGRLVRAEPHSMLRLGKAAAAAIATDDLAALLTQAWGRLCDASEDAGAEDLAARLQRLSSGLQHAGA